MKRILLTVVITLICIVSLFSQTGSITNIQVEQRSDGSGLVDIYFDLNGTGNSYFMNIRVNFVADTIYYPITPSTLTGDVGPISPGTSKHIVWDPMQDHPNRYSPQTKLLVIAYNVESMNPCPDAPTVMDVDGNVYSTAQIGNQCWMRENLNTTRDAAGNNITRYCYENNNTYCELYGGLYSWYTLMNGAGISNSNPSGVQGICPTGWHVPSNAEWTELTDYLINTYADIDTNNVGNKLKSCRQMDSPLGGDCNTLDHPHWNSDTIHYGTNDFGFSALPGGIRSSNNSYGLVGIKGDWRTTSLNIFSFPYSLAMECSCGGVFDDTFSFYDYDFGLSVRCLRD